MERFEDRVASSKVSANNSLPIASTLPSEPKEMLLLALGSGALPQETNALAWISLAALGLVILASCTTKANPGVVAIVLAWIIGVYLAGFWDVSISVREVASGFPSNLFLTLAAVTLLFTQASVNGTLDRVAKTSSGVRDRRRKAGTRC